MLSFHQACLQNMIINVVFHEKINKIYPLTPMENYHVMWKKGYIIFFVYLLFL
jgi:hypothetical protein